jgi:antitoxin MazE
MRVRIQKWGNSLALRIPSAFAAELGLSSEVEVDLVLKDGMLAVSPIATSPTLDELLAGVTPENCHSEVDTGSAVGVEAW